MRVWNKPIRHLTGKDLLKLYILFSVWKGIDRGLAKELKKSVIPKINEWLGVEEETEEDYEFVDVPAESETVFRGGF